MIIFIIIALVVAYFVFAGGSSSYKPPRNISGTASPPPAIRDRPQPPRIEPPKKKNFKVNSPKEVDVAGMPKPFEKSGKTFQTNGITEIDIPESTGRDGFKVTVSSRPRKCPICGSEGTIKKATNGEGNWHCKEIREGDVLIKGCGNTWY